MNATIRHHTPATLLIAALLAGCATSPVTNERLAEFDPDAGYRMMNTPPGSKNSNELFVVLTFSGGGTRAAAFSYGALETLRDTEITWKGERRSLLDEVDVISSVSGGSVTAAYYGLYRERIFEDFSDNVLYADLQRDFLDQILSWSTYFRIPSPGYTRLDVIAETLSAKIYGRQTFQELIMQNRRPFIIINATDITLANRFGFTQDQFDHLYADLSTFEVGHAVAASSAVPGVVTPMILRNFERGEDYRMPEWADTALERHDVSSIAYKQAQTLERYGDPERRYIHLADGGLSDNLGLRPIIQGLLQVEQPVHGPLENTLEGTERIVIITVNAKVETARPWNYKEEPLNLFKALFAATITPLDNHTDTEIMYTQLLVDSMQREADAGRINGPNEFHFVEIAFDYIEDKNQRERLKSLPTSLRLPREDVDLLRKSARQILQQHPEFQRVLEELR
jgi:NTE family protein